MPPPFPAHSSAQMSREIQEMMEMVPPTNSGKAKQLLGKQQSFMGTVTSKLNLESFQIPGYSVQENGVCSMGCDGDLSNSSSSSSGSGSGSSSEENVKINIDSKGITAQPSKVAFPKTESNRGKGQDIDKRTVSFRKLLTGVVLMMTIVICGSIAFPSVMLSSQLSMENRQECTKAISDFATDSGKNAADLGEAQALEFVKETNVALRKGFLISPQDIAQFLAELVLFTRFARPTFDGTFNTSALNGNSIEEKDRAWNESLGPGLVRSILMAGTHPQKEFNPEKESNGTNITRRASLVTWGDLNETMFGILDENKQFNTLCVDSECSEFEVEQGKSPDFSLPANAQFNISDYPAELLQNRRNEAQMPEENISMPNRWDLIPGPEGNAFQLYFTKINCLEEEECTGLITGADIPLGGMSCFLESVKTEGIVDDWDESVMYVVYNGRKNTSDKFSGTITGDTDGSCGTNIKGVKATDSSNELISNSAFIISKTESGSGFGYKDNPTWSWSEYVHLSGEQQGEPCTPIRELNVTEDCNDDGTYKYKSALAGEGNCAFISAAVTDSKRDFLHGPQNVQMQINSTNDVQFMTIAVLRSVSVLDEFADEVTEQYQERCEEKKKQVKEWNILMGKLFALSVGLSILSMLFAFWFSHRFGRSLLTLSDLMSKVQEMQFFFIPPEIYSRISEINKMQRAYNAMCETLEVLAKFVPSSVVKSIINDEKGRRLHVVRKNVTILFSDIQGFTSISEALNHKEMLHFLTKYLSVMTAVVESYDGVVAEILGDGLLCYWNTPDDCDNHRAKACASALAQQQCMGPLNEEFAPMLEKIGVDKLAIRIGIHTGIVLAGNIGSSSKMKFGSIGNATNAASRLEGINKLYGTNILISHDTFKDLPENTFIARELDLVQLKGKSKSMRIYELVGMKNKIKETRESLVTSFDSNPCHRPKRSITKFSSLLPFKKESSNTSSGKAKSACTESCNGGGSDSSNNSGDSSSDSANDPSAESSNNNQRISMGRDKPSLQPIPISRAANPGIGCTSTITEHTYGPVEFFENRLLDDIAIYEEALRAYQAGRFEDALDHLNTIRNPNTASDFLKERVDAAFVEYGKEANDDQKKWDPVLRLDKKDF